MSMAHSFKNKFSLFLLFILFSTSIFSQTLRLKRANKLYSDYNFTEAAVLFQKLEKKDKYKLYATVMLGLCYKNTGQYTLASEWYKKAVDLDPEIDPELIYDFALSLRSAEKYKESEVWMKVFQERKKGTDDIRAKDFASRPNFIQKIKDKPVQFRVNNLMINSPNSDFGPAYFGAKKFVFTSAKEDFKIGPKRIYVWNNQPYLNIYKGNRDETNGNINDVQLWDKNVNTVFHDGPGNFTPNLKYFYFTRNNFYKNKEKKSKKGVNNLKIYFDELNTKDSTYGKTREVFINNDEYSVGHPCINPDGKTIYFTSDMPGGFGGTDIYMAEILSDGNIGKPENLGPTINTESNEMFPFMHLSGLFFFSSNGRTGLGGLDIFVSRYKSGKFAESENVGEPVNGPMDDFGFIMNEVQSQGYFASNRAGGRGDDDIYSFVMIRPFERIVLLKGIATNKRGGAILPKTAVTLFNDKNEAIDDTISDEKGEYLFLVEEDNDYFLVGKKDKFNDGTNKTSTKEMGEKKEVICDLELEMDVFALYGLITDSETKEPLDSATVTIFDQNKNQILKITTAKPGDFYKELTTSKLNDKLDYTIKLFRFGYVPKTVSYKKVIDKPGKISMHQEMDFTMEKFSVGSDLMKVLEINPIYYDLDKYFIRKDAAIELDKIVALLKEYPKMELDIRSHTDCRSKAEYNRVLSNNRYLSAKEYIGSRVRNGRERLTGRGYGESQLLNNCACEPPIESKCSNAEHQLNRRTEFIVKKY